jgi:hypothetical protein
MTRTVTRYEYVDGKYRKADPRVVCPGCGRKVGVLRLYGRRGLRYANHYWCPMAMERVEPPPSAPR